MRAAISLAATAAALTVVNLAHAADFASSCCADIEDRIAELEATAARTGNRKVSLMISGQINKAITSWDDGFESNQYVVDGDFAQSRIRFQGKAKIDDKWEAGYWLELGLDSASSDAVSQSDDGAGLPGATAGNVSGGIEIRPSRWYLKHAEYGTLWVGRGSTSTDNVYKYGNMGRVYSDAELHYNGRFALRREDGAIGLSGTGANAVTRIWDDAANNLDLSRTNSVRYDTPVIEGFQFMMSYGEDAIWDTSLRYENDFGKLKVMWAIGYLDDTDVNGDDPRTGAPIVPSARGNETKDVVGSFGMFEKDIGLYLYTSFGGRRIDDQGFSNALGRQDDTADFLYAQIGVNKEFNTLGATNVHVDAGIYRDWFTGNAITFAGTSHSVLSSEVTRWGFGVTQQLKAADMDIYAVFNYYNLDLDTARIVGGAIVNTSAQNKMEDWVGVTTGARINF